ncbi:MAG: molybdate ABC transporter substrate-binding protein [Actinobacteria bacterium]|nr:molybdate ABC transporter substrate-binding protein [Actinomycetota bacterium]MCL5882555.1 molybdate ABC transporter substrate-binding protein [Actinomycetota bacterium]
MVLWIGACEGSGSEPPGLPGRELTVSAASSLSDAFNEIGKDFEGQHPGVNINFNFGSSGDLEKQIAAGAPVDVFAAASARETGDLDQKGMIIKDTLIRPAGNDLVLVAPAAESTKIGSFSDLSLGQVGKIGVGDPATVPAGRYARDVLTYFDLWDNLQPKLVYGENVRQVLDYVARGEVDAGFVYATDAKTRANDVRIVLTAPAESHQPIEYPMAVITGSPDEQLSRQFLDYVSSKESRPVFERYGFRVNGSG